MLHDAGKSPTRIIGWKHLGWPGDPSGTVYSERRITAPTEAPGDSVLPIGSEVNTALGSGVWCSLPLTLYVDEHGTLPPSDAVSLLPKRPDGWIPSGDDRGTRLADVILFWNVAQHFFPYFDVIDTDWSAQLPIALHRAATDADGSAFDTTLHQMVAQLRDGHGAVDSPYSFDAPNWPFAWAFVEGHLVVTRVDSTLAGRVRLGDEVVAIQGRHTADWVKEAEAVESAATPQYMSVLVANALMVVAGTDTLTLDLRSLAGDSRRELVTSRAERSSLMPARPNSVTEIHPGVMYLDMTRITDADFLAALPRIEAAKGVIFDLRGYPNRISTVVLAHLTDSTITCARWNIPSVMRPDHRDMAFEFSNWPVQPLAPRIRAHAAFLIDGHAISYAETYLGIVEHYHLADLVGEPTAGTNGNITRVTLPGRYVVSFTGMKVLKHDGSRHHGVGILPTVAVSPTIAGIAAGRDEQLERAIAVVSR
jgi:C-terminal processing protease CtpA/Prc